ncbi:TetR family transcriptional regulator [Sulfuriferula plumbiphila]|uniref:TetR family transcriptional regulator n=1 Tax=Sulfuriferula plumbiphila TaxID=171865 RepID=A0A512L759_9PROT|nr:TetR/AcrR family transcriptional regulator [Sulfuriferula plumbiphila]BBP02846.1 TetR family transcriptional regulator [Sulfuriferula plumbiphila]GEP30287.1 TetR family transcriptional regulator [Sulfuriferula plumbiphila]
MPRCREFDIDQALDQALNAFWLKGYAATSMTDLMAAMGLSKSSFYECFGSKREALLAALSRYSARELAETRRHFSAAGPVAALLAAWVRHSIDPAACRPSQRCGCLIVNVAVELAPHDGEIEDAVRRHLDMLAAFLAAAIQRGHADGSIPTRFEPAHGADMLLNLIAGIQVLAKSGVETHRLAAIIDVQLDCLLGHSH